MVASLAVLRRNYAQVKAELAGRSRMDAYCEALERADRVRASARASELRSRERAGRPPPSSTRPAPFLSAEQLLAKSKADALRLSDAVGLRLDLAEDVVILMEDDGLDLEAAIAAAKRYAGEAA